MYHQVDRNCIARSHETLHDCMMTIYRPDLGSLTPRYLALADAIGRDIAAGVLAPGQQLPTHRELAEVLGVSIGTITRGYAEANRRGLTSGEVGRGTYVRMASPATRWGSARRRDGVTDLSLATPWSLPGDEEGRLLGRTMESIAREDGLTALLQYEPATASARQRAAAAAWLEAEGSVPARPDQVVVTAGAQHALMVLLSTLFRPGDVLLVEELTYPGLISAARMMGLRLVGVTLDAEGMVPEALERMCAEVAAKGLYVVPEAQNPTGATMSEGRRRDLVTVARRCDLMIIEDDVHGLLVPFRRTPLAALAPERTIHLATFSKSVSFGLRTAFVTSPDFAVDRLTSGVHATLWMPAPLMTEITLRWLADGTAASIAQRKREEMAARQQLLRHVLQGCGEISGEPHGIHAWLRLPDPWRSDELVNLARQRAIELAGAETWTVGRGPVPHAIRICVGTPQTRAELERALLVLREILDTGGAPVAGVV